MTPNDVPEPEAPRADPAAARKAGFLVVDEAMLRDIMQAAMLDAYNEQKLRDEARDLADQSAEQRAIVAEQERDKLRVQVAKSKTWWRRWIVPVAAVGIVAGAAALGFTIYLISAAKDALREDAAAISERTTTEMTLIATEAAEAAVAASEERTDKKIAAIDTQLQSIKDDVRTEIHGEFVVFREELLRELRSDAP